MQLHLDLQVKAGPQYINHQQAVLLIGSCFTEHIGRQLEDLKFKAVTNPFGIVFNPKSITQSLQRIISNKVFTGDDLINHNGLWHGMEAQGYFSAGSQDSVLDQLNQQLSVWHQYIKTADYLMLTLGTAYVYRHIESGRYVANCHKIPQAQFSKELMTVENMTADLSSALHQLYRVNPACRVILTVSPVKHLRDGVIENNLSKAILIQSVHELVKQHSSCSYFPAYELVIDDLRDYRFFEPDMAHPNKQAIDYVWQKFSTAYFDEPTSLLNNQLRDLAKAIQHRVLKSDSQEFKAFKKTYALKCKTLKEQFPFLNLDKEAEYFQ